MKKYFYSNGKEQFGPLTFEELKQKDISNETLIWFEGLEDWKKAKDIDHLQPILELKPPPLIIEAKNTLNEQKTIKAKTDGDKYAKTKNLKGVKGWLLFLCYILVGIGPIFSVINLFTSFSLMNSIADTRFDNLVYIDTALSLVLIVLSIRAGMALWDIKPHAVRIAKKYLLIFLAYSIFSLFLPIIVGYGDNDLTSELFTGVIKNIFFFGICFAYLSFSKRVKATYTA